MTLNVAGIQPVAQLLVARAAAIYLEHLQPHVVGIVAHGSAVKGGFIPGCSDIDLQVYLADVAFAEAGQISLTAAFAIQRDFSQLDTAPFQYIQGYPLPCTPQPPRLGPIPGAYVVVYGELPVPAATDAALRDAAYMALDTFSVLPDNLANNLLQHGGGKLERRVRFLCTDVWPLLYHVLAVQSREPMWAWGLPKARAIAALPPAPLRTAIAHFHDILSDYYAAPHDTAAALAVIAQGVQFMQAAQAWWSASLQSRDAGG